MNISDSYRSSDHTKHPTWVRYGVLAWLCLAATIAYIHRNCIAVPEEQIRSDLGLSLDEMGWVMSGFFITYAIFQIPAGWLGDRWGSRITLPLYAGVWSLTTGLMGFAGGAVSLLTARAANGTAQAGIVPVSAKSIRDWFPDSQCSLAIGTIGSFQSVGAVVATALTTFLLSRYDWQTIFIALSLPGIVWAVGFYWWFRDLPESHPAVNAEELRVIRQKNSAHLRGNDGALSGDGSRMPEPPGETPWLTMLTSPTLQLLCGQQFFRAAGYIFYATWFPTYLQKTRGVTMEESGYLTALPLLAVVVGSAAGGALSDWIHRRTGSRRLSRKAVATTFLLACALFTLLAFFVAHPTQAVLLITAGSLCAALAGPAGNTLIMELGGQYVATTYATMNMVGNAGAAVCPVVVVWLVGWEGNWSLVLMFFATIYLAAAVCWMFVNPDRPIFDDRAGSLPSPAAGPE